jgi:hypothetical protein
VILTDFNYTLDNSLQSGKGANDALYVLHVTSQRYTTITPNPSYLSYLLAALLPLYRPRKMLIWVATCIAYKLELIFHLNKFMYLSL